MAKKSFATNLQHQVDKQDESLKDRFAAAESVLLSTPTEDLKKATKPAKEEKPRTRSSGPKVEGDLVVRDTFSMPQDDYEIIERLRSKAAKEGVIFTKSEIVRAGLLALSGMPVGNLMNQLAAVEKIKPGRKPD